MAPLERQHRDKPEGGITWAHTYGEWLCLSLAAAVHMLKGNGQYPMEPYREVWMAADGLVLHANSLLARLCNHRRPAAAIDDVGLHANHVVTR